MAITLATLPHATEQAVFDQVAAHLLTQKKRALRANDLKVDYCVYRAPDGLKCAAGCLISDQEYEEAMEGLSWSDLVSNELVPSTHASLIADLQSIHDRLDVPVDQWGQKLIEYARKEGLSFNYEG